MADRKKKSEIEIFPAQSVHEASRLRRNVTLAHIIKSYYYTHRYPYLYEPCINILRKVKVREKIFFCDTKVYLYRVSVLSVRGACMICLTILHNYFCAPRKTISICPPVVFAWHSLKFFSFYIYHHYFFNAFAKLYI